MPASGLKGLKFRAMSTSRIAYTLRLGAWAELGAHAAQVRTQVFVHEQQIPAELEWDALDAQVLHAVAYGAQGQPLATGRLLQPALHQGQIGRMATLAHARGSGLGAAIVQALLQAARERGDSEVMLHAQRSAQSFYERMGFVCEGEPFDEVGIAHITMKQRL
jgi:predicted GNAT family N-acyltransferase